MPSQMFFIGIRDFHAEILTPIPNKEVSKVFSGNQYSIYADDNFEHLWATGDNSLGSFGTGSVNSDIVHKLTPITYFNKHGIKIKQIFVNQSGYGSFFISKDNKLYACGDNREGNLGLVKVDSSPVVEPTLVPDLKNIIDIQSSIAYNIAICTDNHTNFIVIITNWARIHSLPQEIINLIIKFMKTTHVFATTTNFGTGHLKDAETVKKKGWNIVDSFEDKNIIKCSVGFIHSMFLEDNGVLWTCGSHRKGQLGLGEREVECYKLFKPTKIPFFIKEKIVIKDVKCGHSHNIALDVNGKVYSWGDNRWCQCGQGTQSVQYINPPKLIESIKESVIDCIDCGADHSYVRTTNEKHYLFGANFYQQCIKYDDKGNLNAPFRVDQIIKTKCNAKKIIKIQLGFQNTKVTVSI